MTPFAAPSNIVPLEVFSRMPHVFLLNLNVLLVNYCPSPRIVTKVILINLFFNHHLMVDQTVLGLKGTQKRPIAFAKAYLHKDAS